MRYSEWYNITNAWGCTMPGDESLPGLHWGRKRPAVISDEQAIADLISRDASMMHVLRCVRGIELPDWCVCAGFVRAKVWDHLHQYNGSTRLSDVDVVYFDVNDVEETREKDYENILRGLDDSIPWSVKNQARMHVKNGNSAYTSTYDGLSHFPEVCTAIGAWLDSEDKIRLMAPHGVDDLVNLLVRPTPGFSSGDRRAIYEQRIAAKRWHLTWPRLQIDSSAADLP